MIRIIILSFIFTTEAYSASYQLLDFLKDQRKTVPRSHLEMKIESQQRVDFERLNCSEWKGVFTKYLLAPKEKNLKLIGENKKITKQVLSYLMKNSKYAKRLIERIKKSPHTIYIRESKGNSYLNLKVKEVYEHNNAYAVTILEKSSLNLEDKRVPLNKLGGGSVVQWNPTRSKDIKSRAITLAHELYHAYDAARGMLDYRLVIGKGLEQTAVTEYRGVYFENLVRKDLGMKLRKKYSEGSKGSLKNLWIDRPCL